MKIYYFYILVFCNFQNCLQKVNRKKLWILIFMNLKHICVRSLDKAWLCDFGFVQWFQYRIESRVPPGDNLFPIKTIGHIRDRLLHVKEQMDRHKQLMDRYLPDEDTSATTDVKTKIMNMYVDMEQHNP